MRAQGKAFPRLPSRRNRVPAQLPTVSRAPAGTGPAPTPGRLLQRGVWDGSTREPRAAERGHLAARADEVWEPTPRPMQGGDRLEPRWARQSPAAARLQAAPRTSAPQLQIHPEPQSLPARSFRSRLPGLLAEDGATAVRTEVSHPAAPAAHPVGTGSQERRPQTHPHPAQVRVWSAELAAPHEEVGAHPRSWGKAGWARRRPAPRPCVAPVPPLSDCHLEAGPRPGPSSRGQGRVGESR